MFQYKLDMGNGTVFLAVSRSTELWEIPWNSENHDHAGYELHVMLAGKCKLEVEGRILQIRPKDAVLLPPGCFHRAVSTEGRQEHMVVTFTADGPLQQILQETVQGSRLYQVGGDMISLCRAIRSEMENRAQFRGAVMQNLLSLMMAYHLRLLHLPRREENDPISMRIGRKYTDEIDIYFEEDLAVANMDGLAERLHLSRTQVNRLLKKNYGVTFREKLIRARMVRAAWLLTHTDLRVEEVAVTVGYSSLSAFHEMFRSRFDTTPEKYRVISLRNRKETEAGPNG